MTNIASSAFSQRDEVRSARAAFVRDALKSERWSVRAAALAIGTNHTSLGARVKGETAFFAEDIESIAILLKRNPVEFYAEYLAADTKNGPASEETEPSDVPPTGIEPATYGTNVRRFPTERTRRPTVETERLAPVVAISGNRIA